MKKRRWLWLLVAALGVGGGVWLWRDEVRHWIEPDPGSYDATATSADPERDMRLMWETQRLRGSPDPTHGPNPRGSTDRAINAASRVFNTVELVGMTRAEVVNLLGDPKTSSESIYNFPFWPAPRGSLVYRFDCGSYGWQFNVVLDEQGKVSKVERLWIH